MGYGTGYGRWLLQSVNTRNYGKPLGPKIPQKLLLYISVQTLISSHKFNFEEKSPQTNQIFGTTHKQINKPLTIIIDNRHNSLLNTAQFSTPSWIGQVNLEALIFLIFLIINDGNLQILLPFTMLKHKGTSSTDVIFFVDSFHVFGCPCDLDASIAAIISYDWNNGVANALLDKEACLGKFQHSRFYK